MTTETYRAAYTADLVLTLPEHALLPDEDLLAVARETAASVGVTGDITIGTWHGEELADYRGTLCDYATGEPLRPATAEEQAASAAEAERDDTGVIVVDGRSCYVED